MSASRLESLDLNLILALHWLLTERSVSLAAERMHVTQPAMSRSLGRLRDVFHDPLLVKTGRSMEPTPTALDLQPKVEEAIESLREIMRHRHEFDPQTQSGVVTIACVDYLTVPVVEAWAKVITPHAPGLELQIDSLTLDSAHDMITGKTDFIILPELVLTLLPSTIDADQYVRRNLFEQKFITAVHKNHPLASGRMTLKRFLSYPHILINPEGDKIGFVDQALSNLGLVRKVNFRTFSFLSAVSIVRKTDSILTAASGIFNNDSRGLVFFEPPVKMPPLHFHAVWHPNWTGEPRHKWVRDRLLPALSKSGQKAGHMDLIDKPVLQGR